MSANPSIGTAVRWRKRAAPSRNVSALHGINAPEFFDKAVFSSLVLTLRDEGYISDSGAPNRAETMKVYQLLAELITLQDVRLTMRVRRRAKGRIRGRIAGCRRTPDPAYHNLQIQ
ncbi:hypothetical protein ACVXG9_07035 [Escherichia coli]